MSTGILWAVSCAPRLARPAGLRPCGSRPTPGVRQTHGRIVSYKGRTPARDDPGRAAPPVECATTQLRAHKICRGNSTSSDHTITHKIARTCPRLLIRICSRMLSCALACSCVHMCICIHMWVCNPSRPPLSVPAPMCDYSRMPRVGRARRGGRCLPHPHTGSRRGVSCTCTPRLS